MYDKKDYFSFSVIRFPFLDGNIPAKPAYGVYISQLVRIGRVCDNFKDFIAKHTELTDRLMRQASYFMINYVKNLPGNTTI